MMSRILLATAITLSLGTAAFAQTTPAAPTGSAAGQSTDGGGNQQGMPRGWDGPISDAFYSDGTLRSEADVRTGWASLTPEQQTMVRTDCTTFMSAESDSAGGSKPDTSTETSSTNAAETSTGTPAGGATSGASASASDQVASMNQLCGWVGAM